MVYIKFLLFSGRHNDTSNIMSTWISQDVDKDNSFVLHFTSTDDHEDNNNLEQNPENEKHETGEVISQMSLHLLSMPHQTFVNVVQFDQGQLSLPKFL